LADPPGSPSFLRRWWFLAAAVLLAAFWLIPFDWPGVHDAVTAEKVPGCTLELSAESVICEPVLGPARAFVLGSNVRTAVPVWFGWGLVFGLIWALRSLGKTREAPLLRRALRAGAVLLLPLIALLAFFTAFCSCPYIPGYRLCCEDADVVLADFQTHTYYSDGYFSPAFNLAWHRRHGYHAVAVTDPHTLRGAYEAADLAPQFPDMTVILGEERRFPRGGYFLLYGMQHVFRIDHVGVAEELASVVHAHPEASVYLCVHIPHRDRLPAPDLLGAGFDGLEAYNHGWPPSRASRSEMLAAARRWDRPLLGSVDWHGKGMGTKVWTAVRLPGWRTEPNPGKRASRILRLLRDRQTDAFRPLTAGSPLPPSFLRQLADPPLTLAYYFLGLGGAQFLSWGIWLLLAGLVTRALSARSGRPAGQVLLSGYFGIAASFLGVHGIVLLVTGLSGNGVNPRLPGLGVLNLSLCLLCGGIAVFVFLRRAAVGQSIQ
jgi:predicted metal-dependent phosphoesterase TrpH